jgi:FixJ family two-component response regulator
VRSAADHDDDSFLQKPFTSQELLKKVKRALLKGADIS